MFLLDGEGEVVFIMGEAWEEVHRFRGETSSVPRPLDFPGKIYYIVVTFTFLATGSKFRLISCLF